LGLFIVEFVDEMVEAVLAGFVERALLDFLSDVYQENQHCCHEQSQPSRVKRGAE
jgi:hypothetical protein